MHILC